MSACRTWLLVRAGYRDRIRAAIACDHGAGGVGGAHVPVSGRRAGRGEVHAGCGERHVGLPGGERGPDEVAVDGAQRDDARDRTPGRWARCRPRRCHRRGRRGRRPSRARSSPPPAPRRCPRRRRRGRRSPHRPRPGWPDRAAGRSPGRRERRRTGCPRRSRPAGACTAAGLRVQRVGGVEGHPDGQDPGRGRDADDARRVADVVPVAGDDARGGRAFDRPRRECRMSHPIR